MTICNPVVKPAGEFIIEMCEKHEGLMTLDKHKTSIKELLERVKGEIKQMIFTDDLDGEQVIEILNKYIKEYGNE